MLLLFTPASLTAPFAVGLGLQRQHWLDLVVWTLERAGPAFIKWGQWAATRPDLFPPDLCSKLAQLQTGAPTHPYAYTRHAVEAAFGCASLSAVQLLFKLLSPSFWSLNVSSNAEAFTDQVTVFQVLGSLLLSGHTVNVLHL